MTNKLAEYANIKRNSRVDRPCLQSGSYISVLGLLKPAANMYLDESEKDVTILSPQKLLLPNSSVEDELNPLFTNTNVCLNMDTDENIDDVGNSSSLPASNNHTVYNETQFQEAINIINGQLHFQLNSDQITVLREGILHNRDIYLWA